MVGFQASAAAWLGGMFGASQSPSSHLIRAASSTWTWAGSSWISWRQFSDSPSCQIQKNSRCRVSSKGYLAPFPADDLAPDPRDESILIRRHIYCSSWYIGRAQRHSQNWREVGWHWNGENVLRLSQCYQVQEFAPLALGHTQPCCLSTSPGVASLLERKDRE